MILLLSSLVNGMPALPMFCITRISVVADILTPLPHHKYPAGFLSFIFIITRITAYEGALKLSQGFYNTCCGYFRLKHPLKTRYIIRYSLQLFYQ